MVLRLTRTSRWIVLPAVTATIAGVLTVAGSPPAAANIRQQIASAQAQLTTLNDQSEVAAERYNAYRLQLADAQQRAAVARRTLDKANTALSVRQAQITAFVRESYITGGSEGFTSVFTGESPADLISKMSTIQAIGESQQQSLVAFAAAKRNQEAAQSTARAVLAQIEQSTQRALAEKRTVEQNAVKAQQLLTTLRAKQAALIRAAKAASARRAAEARAAALAAEQRRAANAARDLANQPLTPPSTPTAPVHASGNVVQTAIAVAKSELGKPYVWGAAGPNTFDCSGLTMYAYAKAGVSLAHYTGDQWKEGRHVSESQMIPGDLIFFNTDSSHSHVGIYLGGGQFIHAPHTGDIVKISAVTGYYQDNFAGAVRVVG